jgi:hypothetical protein
MDKHEARSKALQKKLEVTAKVNAWPTKALDARKKYQEDMKKASQPTTWKRKGRHPLDQRSTERIPSGLSGYDQ